MSAPGVEHSGSDLDRREHVVVLEAVQRMEGKLDGVTTELRNHIAGETTEIAANIAKLMKDAFPEGDPSGHRRHHELVIERAEARVKFWRQLGTKLAEWGLIGFAGWVLFSIWTAFLKGPKQ